MIPLLEVIMGQPFSIDLRERVSGFVGAGNSRRAAVRHFDVGDTSRSS